MEYRQLGKSDMNVSRVSFGCMSLGDNHETNTRLLHQAVHAGINFFDTADLYQKGFNEETVGRALKSIRKKIMIATKVGNQWRADGSGWDWNPTKKYILDAVEKSLARLQTDYIDLYQLHGGTMEDPIDETIDAFEQLKKQGKIRHYGISSIRPNVIRAYAERSNIVSVMMQYSLLDRRPEETCLELLEQHHIGVLARGSLAGGLLVDKLPKPYLTYSSEEVSRASEAVAAIDGDVRTKTAAALRFVLHHKAIVAAVVGIRTEEQLNASIASMKSKALSDKEYNTLVSALAPNRYQDHR